MVMFLIIAEGFFLGEIDAHAFVHYLQLPLVPQKVVQHQLFVLSVPRAVQFQQLYQSDSPQFDLFVRQLLRLLMRPRVLL